MLLADSFNELQDNLISTINLLESLGFQINWEKSKLIPEKKQKFLGFIINSAEMSISLTEEQMSR